MLDDLQTYGSGHEDVVVAAFSCAVAPAAGLDLILYHLVDCLVVAFDVGLVAYVCDKVADCFVLALDIGVEARHFAL